MDGESPRNEPLELEDGRRLRWREYGHPEGRPVLYCHGLPGSRLEHHPDSGMAARRGIRFIVPDRPGYGRTDPRSGRVLGEEAEDVTALADHLGLATFDVMGFSGGGPHALALAARLPDRVRRLQLISSLAPFDQVGTAGLAEGNRQLWDLARTDFPAFARVLEEAIEASGGAYGLLVGGALEPDREVFADQALASAYSRDLEEALRQGLAGMLEDAAAITAPWPFSVESIEVPAGIWHGEQDANASIAMGRWLAHRLPRAELTEWPGAAHFEIFRRWDETLEALASD